MKVKELVEMFRFDEIHLHESKEGKIVAKTRASIEHFDEADVQLCYCRIESRKDSNWAKSYVYAYVSAADVNRIKQEAANANL